MTRILALDVEETDKAYNFHADVPGFTKEDIKVGLACMRYGFWMCVRVCARVCVGACARTRAACACARVCGRVCVCDHVGLPSFTEEGIK